MKRMFSGQQGEAASSAIYCMNYKARCIAAQAADTEHTRFFLATSSLRDENEIHWIEAPENEQSEPPFLNCFRHKQEVWDLSPSLNNQDLLFTCHNNVTSESAEMSASLWRLQEQSSDLEFLLGLPTPSCSAVMWQPEGSGDTVAAIGTKTLEVFNIEQSQSSAKSIATTSLCGDVMRGVGGAAWDPHHTSQIAVCVDRSIRCIDTRANTDAWKIENAHAQQVRDMDFNPCSLYLLASGGDDSAVKCWDYRKCTKPVAEHSDVHSHWVWRVEFSPSYGDCMMLTCGTDANVNLWDVSKLNNEDSDSSPLIKTYDEHEDSIYSVAWSAADPWTFASLSYDGRAVICTIPQEFKMSILMSGDDNEAE
eukprot:TRINITY_DN2680_c0_g1_i1.p1 TRINITY_DN2680_c0_g1~~TRINITY_DN2680_c0_g1_i1.p1  ORF type:complete len:365 (-),score=62.89 TRINITY_DN2680_c0_g1_i1:94-1188(-)